MESQAVFFAFELCSIWHRFRLVFQGPWRGQATKGTACLALPAFCDTLMSLMNLVQEFLTTKGHLLLKFSCHKEMWLYSGTERSLVRSARLSDSVICWHALSLLWCCLICCGLCLVAGKCCSTMFTKAFASL